MGFRGVLGHEFVGVAESGPFAGRRVVGEINCACHACDTCTAGFPTHCPNRTVLGILNHDGAFADRIAVPQANLHVVPDSLPNDIAVFTEPVAAAYQIPAQLAVGPRDRVVVLGDGRLGNLCAQVLAGLSNHVLVVGKHDSKLALLRARGIATAKLGDALDPRMADIVVDCTGSATGLPTALTLVRPRGTIVLKTTVAGSQELAVGAVRHRRGDAGGLALRPLRPRDHGSGARRSGRTPSTGGPVRPLGWSARTGPRPGTGRPEGAAGRGGAVAAEARTPAGRNG